MMKKFIFLIALFFMSLIPFSVNAWDEISVYNAYEQGNLETIITNCGESGHFNWNKVGIGTNGLRPWAVGNLGGIGNNLTELSLSFKYDLPAQKYYDLQINFNGTPNSNFTTNKAYWYTGSTCGNQTDTGKISYLAFSKGDNYARFRFYTNSIISNWRLDIYSTNYIINGSWGITGVYLREVDTTGTNEIITNNTQNTQTIINNQNNNTQSIINNQNENTQQVIESNRVCNNYNFKNGVDKAKGYLSVNGNINQLSNWFYSDYIKVNAGANYILSIGISANSPSYCLYTKEHELLNCYTYSGQQSITITPSQEGYIRYSLYISSSSSYNNFTGSYCQNGNQSINDTFTDSSIPTGNDYFDDFNDMLPTNNTISNFITLPIRFYTVVLNALDGTCSAIDLGSMYNTNIIMPCINIQQYVGNTIWTTIDLICSGFFIIIISRVMVKIFHKFTDFDDKGDVIH